MTGPDPLPGWCQTQEHAVSDLCWVLADGGQCQNQEASL
jgi:hypothetical protein